MKDIEHSENSTGMREDVHNETLHFHPTSGPSWAGSFGEIAPSITGPPKAGLNEN